MPMGKNAGVNAETLKAETLKRLRHLLRRGYEGQEGYGRTGTLK